MHPPECYLNDMVIATQSHRDSLLKQIKNFDTETFIKDTIRPFTADFIKEIEIAFNIPSH